MYTIKQMSEEKYARVYFITVNPLSKPPKWPKFFENLGGGCYSWKLSLPPQEGDSFHELWIREKYPPPPKFDVKF